VDLTIAAFGFSALLLVALVVVLVLFMRLRGHTREVEQALAEQSGSKERADMLMAVAQAVNEGRAGNAQARGQDVGEMAEPPVEAALEA